TDNDPLLFVGCSLILILHTYVLVASTSGLRWGIIGASIAIGLSGLFLKIPYFLYDLIGLHLLIAVALAFRLWRRHRHLMALFNSDAPVKALTSEIKRHGESLELLNLLAGAHGKNKDFETAIPHLRRCLELQPEHSVVLANLAWYLSETRAFAESEEIFQSLIAKPQNKKLSLLVRANYSCMLAESGRVRESEELLTAVEQECATIKKLGPVFQDFLNDVFKRVHAKLDETVSSADG
ncbi:MAG TPA: hypothetical protein PK992_11255, partial [Planctomycetaceae bacterium]|nr:hypothetical protein [Planctomycetaceae bacterium]